MEHTFDSATLMVASYLKEYLHLVLHEVEAQYVGQVEAKKLNSPVPSCRVASI